MTQHTTYDAQHTTHFTPHTTHNTQHTPHNFTMEIAMYAHATSKGAGLEARREGSRERVNWIDTSPKTLVAQRVGGIEWDARRMTLPYLRAALIGLLFYGHCP